MIQLRKSVAVLAGVFLTGIFLIGCQNAQDMQPTVGMLKGIEAIAPIDQVEYEACTITFSLWGDEAADSEILAAVEVFEEKYPGMQVQIETGGKISDVNRFKQIIPEESFYNLYEAYDVLSLGEFGQENLNRCTVEERLQAVPSKLSVKTFLYNETLFEQAGLSVPDSLDDLLKAGNVFREKLGEDYYPLAMDQTDRVLFMIQYLQSLYGKNWTVDSVLQYKVEELMKGMELLLSMEEAHVIPSLEHLSQNSVEQGWTSGVYASVFDWDDQAGQYGGMLAGWGNAKGGCALKGY